MQLTWLDNYRTSSADAGVDLVAKPDAMLDPVISARVLFRGLMDGRWNGKGKGLGHYEGEDDHLSDAEAAAARRTVNVQDKAALIAGYHRKYYDALTAAGWKPKSQKPLWTGSPGPMPSGPTTPSKSITGPVLAVGGAISAVVAWWNDGWNWIAALF